MDLDRQGALFQAHDRGCCRIKHLLHMVNLDEMVASSQGAQLRPTALPCTHGHLVGVSAFDATSFFSSAQVSLTGEALLVRPACTFPAYREQFTLVGTHRSILAHT